MENYDYGKEVRNDCEEAIKELISSDGFEYHNLDIQDYDTADEFIDAVAEKMTEILMDDDAVTGGGSGSYYCNSYKAEESLAHNLDLLVEACDEFGLDVGEQIRNGAECADLVIRQYEVYQEIGNAIENVSGELEQYFDEKTAELSVDKD